MKNLRLNSPFREYAFLTDAVTRKQIAVCAKRVVNIFPSDTAGCTIIDCGQNVGFETYFVAETLQQAYKKINAALYNAA